MQRALQRQLTSNGFIEQSPAISVDSFKTKGANMLFLDFLSWSYCYIFSIWYVSLIVIDFLRNETLCLDICFIPILPSLIKSLPNFEFAEVFAMGMERPPPPIPFKVLKNVPVVIAYNIKKENNCKLSCQFSS